MKSIKILHTADWHFDCKFSGITSSEVRKQLTKEKREIFKKVIEEAQEQNADLFLIAGDLFEQNSFKLETINFIISCLSQLNCPVLITPGNHDPYINDSPYKLLDWGQNIHIFSENKFSQFNFKDASIYGIANTVFNDNKHCLENIYELIEAEQSKFRIIMLHGTYVNLLPFISKEEVCLPFTDEEIKNLNVQYIALGHFHNFKDISIQNKKIFYPGTPFGNGFKDFGPRYAVLAEINELDCKIEKIKVNKRDFVEIKFDISEVTNKDSLCEYLKNEIKRIQCENNLLRIILSGTSQFQLINIDELENELQTEFFYVLIKNNAIPIFNIEELSKTNTLVGEFIRHLQNKINKANSEDEKNILNKSLNYGLKALLNNEEIEL